MAALAFTPWITFRSAFEPNGPGAVEFHVSGARISALRDDEVIDRNDVESRFGWCSCHTSPGDGYIIAVLGGVIAVAAVAGIFTSSAGWVPPIAVLLGLAAVAVAGYNAFAEDWGALSYQRSSLLQAVNGTQTVWLYLELGVSVAAGILGALLWGIVRTKPDDYDEDEIEAWA